MAAKTTYVGIGPSNVKTDNDVYANWMGNLPAALTSKPIHSIGIPGSHESFSYSIDVDSEISPDNPELYFINKIPILRRIVKPFVYRWSVCQKLNCTQQMECGVRYLDLRLAPNHEKQTINLVHGIYGTTIDSALKEVLTFLQTHDKEIVFLDFQHFYDFTFETHEILTNMIVTMFDQLLVPVTDNLDLLTIDYLWKNGTRVFIFYRIGNADIFRANRNYFWPSQSIPNPWPETVSPISLIDFLESRYKQGRPVNKFYVTQGVLTPDKTYVFLHICYKLFHLIQVANKVLPPWLEDKFIGKRGINIMISDLIGSADCIVSKIIELNFKS